MAPSAPRRRPLGAHASATAEPRARVPPRHRVFYFREWLARTYGALAGTVVLDVAGGKGDLAWLLANADGADAVVADPRLTDHSKVARASRHRFMLSRSREHENRGRGETESRSELTFHYRTPLLARARGDPALAFCTRG